MKSGIKRNKSLTNIMEFNLKTRKWEFVKCKDTEKKNTNKT